MLVNLVSEQGQFANLKKTMRNVILEAHRDIYAANPNDYFIVWRGGDLNRFVPWQSASKSYGSAQGVMYQMVQGGYGGGRSVDTYVVHKNNMIDLDALGLSYSNEKEIIVLPTSLNSAQEISNLNNINLLISKLNFEISKRELNIERSRFSPTASIEVSKTENSDFSSTIDEKDEEKPQRKRIYY